MDVTVAAPEITLFSLPTTVGAGLQVGALTARLGGSDHGGVTLRIASSNAAVALVSASPSTAGSAFIDVAVPAGQTDVSYYIQGTAAGSTGAVTITASAPGFVTKDVQVQIAPTALQIESLPTSIDATAVSAPFWVRVGVADVNNNFVAVSQPVRAGSSLTATLSLTHQSGTPSQLVTLAGGAQSRQVSITGGNTTSPLTVAAGGVAFDPLTAGTSTVTATIPGATTTAAGQQSVEITSSLVGASAPSGKGNGPTKKRGG